MNSHQSLVTAFVLAGAASASLAGALWYWILMSGFWGAEAMGPICHHGAPLGLHCPACYVALSLVAGGLGATLFTGRRTAPARPAR